MKQMSLFPDEVETKELKLSGVLHDIAVIFREENEKLREEAFKKFHQYKYQLLLEEEKITMESIKELIQFSRIFRDLSGPYRKFIERELLETLKYIVSAKLRDVNIKKIPHPFYRKDIDRVTDRETKQRFLMVLEIVDFIQDTLQHKRFRDSKSGSRKAMALELAADILNCIGLPELLESVLKSLKSNSPKEVLAALDVLNEYYNINDNDLNKRSTASVLFDLANRTRDRNILHIVCGVLCRMGQMTEAQAIDRLDSL